MILYDQYWSYSCKSPDNCVYFSGTQPFGAELRASMFNDARRVSPMKGLVRHGERFGSEIFVWIMKKCMCLASITGQTRDGNTFLLADPSEFLSFELVGRPSVESQPREDMLTGNIGVGHTRMSTTSCFLSVLGAKFTLRERSWTPDRATIRAFHSLSYRMVICQTSITYQSNQHVAEVIDML